jgi:steroid delta-isomerase-like uncharacterized protein
VERARAADAAAGASPEGAAATVRALYQRVWSGGDAGAIPRLVAPAYSVTKDPGDPWEGQTLDHEAYAKRVAHSRTAFPDLAFEVHETIAELQRVSVRWSASGTHEGDLPGLPATKQRVTFSGQTIYALTDGRVCGHWQVIDRLGFLEQVGGIPRRG